MKLTCQREELLKVAQSCAKAIDGKASLPSLRCLVLNAAEGKLSARGADLTLEIASGVVADIASAGGAGVESDLFVKALSKMGCTEVSIEMDGKALILKGGGSRFSLNALAVDDLLPPMGEDDDFTVQFAVDGNALRDGVESVRRAQSVDQAKGVHCGILFEIEGETLCLVTTDNARIAHNVVLIEGGGECVYRVVPTKCVNELARLPDNAKVIVSVSEAVIRFAAADLTISSRLIEGQFAAWRNIWKKIDKPSRIALVRTEELASCLERAVVIAKDNAVQKVKVCLAHDCMELSAENYTAGQFDEKLTVELTGEPFEFYASASQLLDGLRGIGTETLTIELSEPLRPVVLRAVPQSEYWYVNSVVAG